MKSLVFSVAIFLLAAIWIRAEPSFRLTNGTMKLNGSAHVTFHEPQEYVWAGLSKEHRYPLIKNGDRIALRLAYTRNSYQRARRFYWMGCTTSACYPSTCPGGVVMKASKWSRCRVQTFFIQAHGKVRGQPINSGDYVTLSSGYYDRRYRLYCSSSTSYRCRLTYTHNRYFNGNNWFSHRYLAFQIFSRKATDGTPVQYGDVVGFRFPYYYTDKWLTYSGSYWYPRTCSRRNKLSCARKNSPTGLRIFKQL